MFITSVHVNDLFGLYNMSIEFTNEVSIVIGPNGCGKSTILKLIDDTVTGIKCNIPATESKVVLASGEELTPDTCREAVSVYQMSMIPDLSTCLKSVEHDADQICMFTSIINKAFEVMQKKIIVKDQGFVITRNDKEINQAWLSASEQYLISLYFNLIFKAKNCLVIIDDLGEGLHIEVQESLIDNIKAIAKQNALQVIAVTHSPNVINDHLNLIAELTVKKLF